MVIDRENDRYVEKGTDYESDEVIRQCEEPLSQHQGHGSARGRKQKHKQSQALRRLFYCGFAFIPKPRMLRALCSEELFAMGLVTVRAVWLSDVCWFRQWPNRASPPWGV